MQNSSITPSAPSGPLIAMQFGIHDLSAAEILKQPEQFEATLNKILGKKASQEAIKSIVDRLKNEMLFEHWAA
jgi:hypothetical protein